MKNDHSTVDSVAVASGKKLGAWLDKSEKWNQRLLASRTKIPESTISRWINGKRAPSIAVANKIEKATGLSLPVRCPTCGTKITGGGK